MNKKEFWTALKTNGERGCLNCHHYKIRERGGCSLNIDFACAGKHEYEASKLDGTFEYNKWEWDGETEIDENGKKIE